MQRNASLDWPQSVYWCLKNDSSLRQSSHTKFDAAIRVGSFQRTCSIGRLLRDNRKDIRGEDTANSSEPVLHFVGNLGQPSFFQPITSR
jgi:hypothetical protein